MLKMFLSKNNIYVVPFIACIMVLFAECGRSTIKHEEKDNSEPVDALENKILVENSLPIGVDRLLSVYSEHIKDYKNNKIYFADGTSMIYDDGVEKSFEEKLNNPDIEDMFSIKYNDSEFAIPEYLADAGRIRCDTLFKKMYGETKQDVIDNLEPINWFGKRIQVTKINGVADSLKKVKQTLESLNKYETYMTNSSSFNWRKVRGTTNRMSAHSYGIAIDINICNSDYWVWKYPNAREIDTIEYVSRIPMEIVEVFEKYGFIWGGRWYHFDTMHFEFRPELLR